MSAAHVVSSPPWTLKTRSRPSSTAAMEVWHPVRVMRRLAATLVRHTWLMTR